MKHAHHSGRSKQQKVVVEGCISYLIHRDPEPEGSLIIIYKALGQREALFKTPLGSKTVPSDKSKRAGERVCRDLYKAKRKDTALIPRLLPSKTGLSSEMTLLHI